MRVELISVRIDEKEILRNLLEKYLYECSQWEENDVNALGLYGYNWLDCYWTEPNRWPFFLKVQGNLAGFAMVNDYCEVAGEQADYVMAEFFVMYKYRRSGVGREAAAALFDRFRGKWQLMRHPANRAGVLFWDSVIAGYTRGNYRLVSGPPGATYPDGTPGDVFFFDSSSL